MTKKKEVKNSSRGISSQDKPSIKSEATMAGITLVALVVTKLVPTA